MKIMFHYGRLRHGCFDDKGRERGRIRRFLWALLCERGGVMIEGGEGRVKLSKGASCFGTGNRQNIKIKSETEESVILKTYIPIND